MKLLSIAFDLEMFFFSCSCKFWRFEKKKEGKTEKNFTDFTRRANYRKRERDLKLRALHATRLCRSPRVNFFARIRSSCLSFYLIRSRERKITKLFKVVPIFEKFLRGRREREREKKGCPE